MRSDSTEGGFQSARLFSVAVGAELKRRYPERGESLTRIEIRPPWRSVLRMTEVRLTHDPRVRAPQRSVILAIGQ
jgi:hypothetical protein